MKARTETRQGVEYEVGFRAALNRLSWAVVIALVATVAAVGLLTLGVWGLGAAAGLIGLVAAVLSLRE